MRNYRGMPIKMLREGRAHSQFGNTSAFRTPHSTLIPHSAIRIPNLTTSSFSPLSLLALLLLVLEPLGFAWYASGILTRAVDRGALAIAILLLRLIVTAIGMAAGLRLWREREAGVPLAIAALALGALTTVIITLVPALPTTRAPGIRGPIAAALLLYDVAWIAYLWRRRTREVP